MISGQGLRDVGLNGVGHKKHWISGQTLQVNNVLTGQHSGEEDVVREGDKATFSQCVKYAVLICKFLSLLGYPLLIQARVEKGRSYIKNISHDSAQVL